jgi:alkylation response protein AidB-like acyl-CoA dehydrogenase
MGGQEVSHTAAARVLEEISGDCMTFAFALMVQNNAAGVIVRSGSAKQIERLLPALLSCSRMGAFCLSEPEVGSDATAISTTARKLDHGWELNGTKAWVTNGSVAQVLCVYAQTDPGCGWRGIACFLVESDTPGLYREPAYALVGTHAAGTNGFRFSNCRVPDENLLLPAGEGFKAAMTGINRARAFIAAMCCGMLRKSLGLALDHAHRRQAFGRAIAEFQGLQWQLADIATDLEAARVLTYEATRALDNGDDAILAAAYAKKFATRIALTRIADCMHVMGAVGYRADYPLGRHLANAKMSDFIDGTTGIQNIVISRRLLQVRTEP